MCLLTAGTHILLCNYGVQYLSPNPKKNSNWNILYAVLFEKQYIKSRTFNDKNRWIIKKVMVFKKLLPHLATRGTYSPGDWRCDEAWREQTLVCHPVMCQQRLIYCTWELNVMDTLVFVRAPSDVGSFVHTAISNENRELSHTTPGAAERTPEAATLATLVLPINWRVTRVV